MRVNGLYGHVRKNDVRSVALFAGFVVAFHLLAALALVVPLAMLDPEHAPLYGWTGYLVRWVPILTVVGILLFAVQMACFMLKRRVPLASVRPSGMTTKVFRPSSTSTSEGTTSSSMPSLVGWPE